VPSTALYQPAFWIWENVPKHRALRNLLTAKCYVITFLQEA
jgi:hypothetical protein